MPKSKPLIDQQGEVRELSMADVRKMRPASETLPASLQARLRTRGPQKAPTKERITIRLSPEVVQPFRETGDGWQARLDAALKDWLRTHEPANVV
ncbi:MAG: BrnA antitoxin family protein [Burkholderiaceae bacterium]